MSQALLKDYLESSHILFSRKRALTSKSVGILFISSYVPRRCGIATFTRDLTTALNLLNPQRKVKIAAVDDVISQQLEYQAEVVLRVRQDEPTDYQRLVKYINQSKNIDVVCVQHEYGIYGSNNGEKIVEYLQKIKKPIITTFHTVLLTPSQRQKMIIHSITQLSFSVVVMLEKAARMLETIYGIDKDKIIVISHGVPDFPQFNPIWWKRRLHIAHSTVMSSINLLSEAKGIEYVIQALPHIVQSIPNFLYLVIGQTHPVYLKERHGKDLYRHHLKRLSRSLGISNHVRFINKYINLDELIAYIGASDYYITPYLDPQQVTSGALSYAIGAGKVCISTPYLYAKEMLSFGRGIVVPFKNSQAIAKAVTTIAACAHKKTLIEAKTYQIGKTMAWSNVAYQYHELFLAMLKRRWSYSTRALTHEDSTVIPNCLEDATTALRPMGTGRLTALRRLG